MEPRKQGVAGRKRLRLPGYDYASAGAYFITICTHRRLPLFGAVVHGVTRLNLLGDIVQQEWERSSQMRRELETDASVIMPNHLHGIVIIQHTVGAHGRAPLPHAPQRRPPRSLGSFIAGFKSSATRRINQLGRSPGAPVWQRNYYEHIIRDEAAMNRIREHIQTNPAGWQIDRENPRRQGNYAFESWLQAQGRLSLPPRE